MAQAHGLTPLFRTSLSSPSVELVECFASQVAVISPIVDKIMQFIRSSMSTFDDINEIEGDIAIAITEALANAVIHGNHGNANKQVHVSCHCNLNGEVSIAVRDEGQGFHTHTVPDPTARNNVLLSHGRGILLMQALMNEVCFEENGKVVRMRKQLRRPPD